MADRMQLHKILINLLGSDHAYYDPPENVKLQYPCFIYSDENPYVRNANNRLYTFTRAYNVIYINKNPDNGMTQKMFEAFQYVRAGSSYVTEGLHHYTFDIYY